MHYTNARMTHQILEPPTMDGCLRVLTYDLQKTLPNYLVTIQHIYNYYMDPVMSFTNSTDKDIWTEKKFRF